MVRAKPPVWDYLPIDSLGPKSENPQSIVGNTLIRWGFGEMRRILVCLVFSLLLLCSVVGLKNMVPQDTAGNPPVLLAAGSMPPAPIPHSN